jgi:hypothetical protein
MTEIVRGKGSPRLVTQPAHQGLEAMVVTQRVEPWIDVDPVRQPERMIAIGQLQPVQRLIGLAQSGQH